MQEAIVTVIVVLAAWSVVTRYAPESLRKTTRSWAARTARNYGWLALVRYIEGKEQAAASCADGCGSCKGCGPLQGTPEKTSAITPGDLKKTMRKTL
jgi:hypothetical protein